MIIAEQSCVLQLAPEGVADMPAPVMADANGQQMVALVHAIIQRTVHADDFANAVYLYELRRLLGFVHSFTAQLCAARRDLGSMEEHIALVRAPLARVDGGPDIADAYLQLAYSVAVHGMYDMAVGYAQMALQTATETGSFMLAGRAHTMMGTDESCPLDLPVSRVSPTAEFKEKAGKPFEAAEHVRQALHILAGTEFLADQDDAITVASTADLLEDAESEIMPRRAGSDIPWPAVVSMQAAVPIGAAAATRSPYPSAPVSRRTPLGGVDSFMLESSSGRTGSAGSTGSQPPGTPGGRRVVLPSIVLPSGTSSMDGLLPPLAAGFPTVASVASERHEGSTHSSSGSSKASAGGTVTASTSSSERRARDRMGVSFLVNSTPQPATNSLEKEKEKERNG